MSKGQPRSPEVHSKLMVCVMTLYRFEASFDRIAPAFLMALGLVAAFAIAGIGG